MPDQPPAALPEREAVAPEVFGEEIPAGPPPVTALETGVAGFVGHTRRGPLGEPVLLTGLEEFHREFGRRTRGWGMGTAISDFFANGGSRAVVVRVPEGLGSEAYVDASGGLRALERSEWPVSLLVLPPRRPQGRVPDDLWSLAAEYAAERGIFLIIDPRRRLGPDDVAPWVAGLGLSSDAARNAAVYYPRIQRPSPRSGGSVLESAVPCGSIAGIYARTDRERGVWKPPAGLQTQMVGVLGPEVELDDHDGDLLNPQGINCIRTFADRGTVLWGARTLRGADSVAEEYKYVPVRRTALHLRRSIEAGLGWTHGEANGEQLWESIRSSVASYLDDLWRLGACAGSRPQEAYLVRCDATTTTAADIADGVVQIVVGFAPTRPAEFVTFTIRLPLA